MQLQKIAIVKTQNRHSFRPIFSQFYTVENFVENHLLFSSFSAAPEIDSSSRSTALFLCFSQVRVDTFQDLGRVPRQFGRLAAACPEGQDPAHQGDHRPESGQRAPVAAQGRQHQTPGVKDHGADAGDPGVPAQQDRHQRPGKTPATGGTTPCSSGPAAREASTVPVPGATARRERSPAHSAPADTAASGLSRRITIALRLSASQSPRQEAGETGPPARSAAPGKRPPEPPGTPPPARRPPRPGDGGSAP